jgi:hypothetical protein
MEGRRMKKLCVIFQRIDSGYPYETGVGIIGDADGIRWIPLWDILGMIDESEIEEVTR